MTSRKGGDWMGRRVRPEGTWRNLGWRPPSFFGAPIESRKRLVTLNEFFDPVEPPPRRHFVEVIGHWAEHQPAETAFLFSDGEREENALTHGELWERTRKLAGYLRKRGASGGERVLLLYPPGLDFVIGFFACLAAGAVAVPSALPRRNQRGRRVGSILEDCGARFALSVDSVVGRIRDKAGAPASELEWIVADDPACAAPEAWEMPRIGGDEVAMLQYTSGSTGDPRGVMLTHANLLRNCESIVEAFRPDRSGLGATWLPAYHDMGLVGGILFPTFAGRPNVLMSPLTFLRDPRCWLEVISRHGVTVSGGPDFSYQLCVDKVDPESLDGLDLSSWDVAFNGAEPIRPETLRAFVEKFSAVGFRESAFFPCYGMAETTLILTGGPKTGPVTETFRGARINQRRVEPVEPGAVDARELVGCGEVLSGGEVVIVDPDSGCDVDESRIGEIWARSPSIGKGYWNDEATTESVFAATRVGDPAAGAYLRTGDLGFLRHGQLFVTGRIKDVIIVRGVNRYPQDLERTAELVSDAVPSGGVAAFGMTVRGRDGLVLIAEAGRRREVDWDREIDSIRRAILAEHDLAPEAIFVVRAGSVPRTTSGKIQRHACRELVTEGSLKIVAQWEREGEGVGELEPAATATEPPLEGTIRAAVIEAVRVVAGERADVLTRGGHLITDLGLDSLERLSLAHALEKQLGGRFPESVLARIETIDEIVAAAGEYLAASDSPQADAAKGEIDESAYRFDQFPEYRRLKQTEAALARAGFANPYFTVHEGITGGTTRIGGRDFINFASYNYLGLSGHPEVSAAARAAIDRYGTSAGASRLVSGNRPVHESLERALAAFLGAEAAVTFVSGHGTNESTIGHLVGPGDLILHDAFSHNSIVQGARLSGARRRPFHHNDAAALDRILDEVRSEYRRVLIVIEGVYSMDGDFPDLPQFVELKERHRCLLMVDEAHSLGTLGATGRGLREVFDLEAGAVDIWMGTLSKALGSCGGYIAGSDALIEYLRYTAPGFVYSVGMPPASAAAARAALEILDAEPERVERLRTRSHRFLTAARERELDTGLSREGVPIIPILTGSSQRALHLSRALHESGINVQPVLSPVVSESGARLRFFVTSEHTDEQIDRAVAETSRGFGI